MLQRRISSANSHLVRPASEAPRTPSEQIDFIRETLAGEDFGAIAQLEAIAKSKLDHTLPESVRVVLIAELASNREKVDQAMAYLQRQLRS